MTFLLRTLCLALYVDHIIQFSHQPFETCVIVFFLKMMKLKVGEVT